MKSKNIKFFSILYKANPPRLRNINKISNLELVTPNSKEFSEFHPLMCIISPITLFKILKKR